jgi:DNA-binding CsgD family transcriptional regulator
MIPPEQALAAAHADARLRIEAAKTVLRMAIMFPDKMDPLEACERALEELDKVPQVAILLREVPVEVPYEKMSQAALSIDGLSPQQQKVITLVGEGYTNEEIGKLLHLSPATVKSHLARIFKVMKVHTRAEAVARAMEHKYGSHPRTY